MAKQKKAETPAEESKYKGPSVANAGNPPPPEPDPRGLVPGIVPKSTQVFAEGHRTYLYSAECPKGKIFTGQAANEALADGWVDSPAKIKPTK